MFKLSNFCLNTIWRAQKWNNLVFLILFRLFNFGGNKKNVYTSIVTLLENKYKCISCLFMTK